LHALGWRDDATLRKEQAANSLREAARERAAGWGRAPALLRAAR